MKTKYDDLLVEMAQSGQFRVNVAGHLQTTRKWDGHMETSVPWYNCGRNDGRGYLCVSYRGYRVKAHRLAYLLHHPGAKLAGLEINHLDGDPRNNRSRNLELCSAPRQSKHAFDIGLNKSRGESHANAKLTNTIVRRIRKLRGLGVPYLTLAEKYGVSPRTIMLACTRQTWAHVK